MTDVEAHRTPQRVARLVTASTVRPKQILWMYPDETGVPVEERGGGMIPYGGLSIVFGPPGQGKSQFTLSLAASLSTKGIDSFLVGAEDALDDTIVPRLIASDADLSRIHHFVVDSAGREDIPILPTDVPLLEDEIKRKQAKLVILDPVKGHLAPELNENSDHSLRQALIPLARVAQVTGAAIVVVLHPRKGREGSTLERIGGGAGFGGVARSVLLFGRKHGDDEFSRIRYLAHVKCNGAPLARSRMMEVKTVTINPIGFDITTSTVAELGVAWDVRAKDLD